VTGLLDNKRMLVAIAGGLVLAILAAQALAGITAPAQGVASTGRVLGRTGFAYLGGLRTFAAAVLWNRIEPQFHEYYGGVPIEQQTYMIPTLRLVVALDPQFAQAYYISSYIVYQHSHSEGLALAKDAVRSNPNSGILRANLAQLLFLEDKTANRGEILANVKAGLSPAATWLDPAQQYEGSAMMMQVLDSLGETRAAQAVSRRLDQIRSSGAELGDHDHDQDGEQDH